MSAQLRCCSNPFVCGPCFACAARGCAAAPDPTHLYVSSRHIVLAFVNRKVKRVGLVVVCGMPEVARLYGVEEQTVRVWRPRGVLPAEDLKFGREPAWMLTTLRNHRRARASAATIRQTVVEELEAARGFEGPAVLLGYEHIAELTDAPLATIKTMAARGQLARPDLRVGSKLHKDRATGKPLLGEDGKEVRGTPVWRLSTITGQLNGALEAEGFPKLSLTVNPKALERLSESNRVNG